MRVLSALIPTVAGGSAGSTRVFFCDAPFAFALLPLPMQKNRLSFSRLCAGRNSGDNVPIRSCLMEGDVGTNLRWAARTRWRRRCFNTKSRIALAIRLRESPRPLVYPKVLHIVGNRDVALVTRTTYRRFASAEGVFACAMSSMFPRFLRSRCSGLSQHLRRGLDRFP